jgi:carbonic anhydrase
LRAPYLLPAYVKYFNYLGSIRTYDARCTREKSWMAMEKAEFNKKALFTSRLELNLKKKLVRS